MSSACTASACGMSPGTCAPPPPTTPALARFHITRVAYADPNACVQSPHRRGALRLERLAGRQLLLHLVRKQLGVVLRRGAHARMGRKGVASGLSARAGLAHACLRATSQVLEPGGKSARLSARWPGAIDAPDSPSPATASIRQSTAPEGPPLLLTLSANCLVCTKKSRRWCLKAVKSLRSNMPATHAATCAPATHQGAQPTTHPTT